MRLLGVALGPTSAAGPASSADTAEDGRLLRGEQHELELPLPEPAAVVPVLDDVSPESTDPVCATNPLTPFMATISMRS